ncbi:hypothetical protein GF389_05930, partial [Candidatus Dojkabacteria bacterium]|nr:hypothetical protein [Candidatus Dojkabacteria bacterium]
MSDSVASTTGYANVSRNILNLLSDDFDIHHLAHNYIGMTIKPPINFEDGTVFKGNMVGQGRVRYSLDKIPQYIKKKDIDCFGVLLDLFMLMENHGA